MIRGIKRPMPLPKKDITNVNVPITASIHNRFDIEIVDVATGEIRQKAMAENVICNQLWTRLFTPAQYFAYMHFGTGSGTPDITDTSLFTFFGYSSPMSAEDVYDHSDWLNGVIFRKRKFQIMENVAVGSTLTEVGIAYGTAANTLCTHAMLRDMNGNQISIVKTATDIINVYATIFVHFNGDGYDEGHIKLILQRNWYDNKGFMAWLLDGTRSESNNGSRVRYGMFPIGMTNDIGKSGSADYPFLAMPSVYSIPNKTLILTGTRIDVNSQNYNGGSQCVLLSERGHAYPTAYADADSPFLELFVGGSWYPGTQISQEPIGTGDGITKDFLTKFNYASDATIYIDGIPATGVSVENIPHRISNALYGFNVLAFHIVAGSSAIRTSPIIYSPLITSASRSSTNKLEATIPYTIFENRLWMYGVASFTAVVSAPSVECSNDLLTWYTVTPITNIPVEYRNHRYWKFAEVTMTPDTPVRISAATFDTPPPITNIHFDTPPPVGAVITADYFTKTIAKDTNHVFDLTVTIQLGEYTET